MLLSCSLASLSLFFICTSALAVTNPSAGGQRQPEHARDLSRRMITIAPFHPSDSHSLPSSPHIETVAAPAAGWAVLSACAYDDPRLLLDKVSFPLPNDNTPAACIAHCDRAGYLYASVEYGRECRCAPDIDNEYLKEVDPQDCDTPCTGDASKTCGGAFLTQLYRSTTTTGEARPYGQCAGLGWRGPTICPKGFRCKFLNILYSQCNKIIS